jgi:hypothetical protein
MPAKWMPLQRSRIVELIFGAPDHSCLLDHSPRLQVADPVKDTTSVNRKVSKADPENSSVVLTAAAQSSYLMVLEVDAIAVQHGISFLRAGVDGK